VDLHCPPLTSAIPLVQVPKARNKFKPIIPLHVAPVQSSPTSDGPHNSTPILDEFLDSRAHNESAYLSPRVLSTRTPPCRSSPLNDDMVLTTPKRRKLVHRVSSAMNLQAPIIPESAPREAVNEEHDTGRHRRLISLSQKAAMRLEASSPSEPVDHNSVCAREETDHDPTCSPAMIRRERRTREVCTYVCSSFGQLDRKVVHP
jgi:hypothetical protein